jgi:hypothetical protein
MAKQLVHHYTFAPSEDKVILVGNILPRRLLLITNVTDGVVIYNFADDQLNATSITYDPVDETTIVILKKDCNQMSASDKLQIFYEQDYVKFEPSETYVDPVSKFRVSNPENLVDTDFEYGPQASKWETLQTINNIPSFYASTADTTLPFITRVQSVAGNELITVTTEFDHSLTSGVPITVTGLSSVTAEGSYLIQSVPNSKQFTYKGRSAQQETGDLQGAYTSIIPGKFYQGAQIAVDEAIGIVSDYYTKVVTVSATIQLTLTTVVPDTWEVGSLITSDAGANGTISKISNSIVTLYNTSGTFTVGSTLNATGSSTSGTIDTDGVGTFENKFFIDGQQQPAITLNKKAIYRFDLSSSSLSGHPLRFSTTSDGTHNSGVEYTTYVYSTGTPGTEGAYIRIYVTNTTPDLYYYCGDHSGMGGSASVVSSTNSKIYLTTLYEHGFADNTNFYFVNTISPKILEVEDSEATAPDGRPYVDFAETKLLNPDIDETRTIPYNYESTYTLRFSESDVNYAENTITIPNHNLQSGYSLLYYPNPGDTPITGLSRMQVFYVQRIDSNTIKLSNDARNNLPIDLQTGGTFTYGTHNLGLCYNCYREYKAYGSYNAYWYTYYWNFGGTYSGHDFATVNSTFGLGGQAWDIVAAFSTSRPGYANAREYYYNYAFRFAFGTSWRTYGYHLQSLPLGPTAQFQGGYDFLTDHENYGVNGNNNGGYSYGYTIGGYNQVNAKTYWTVAVSGNAMNSSYLNVYGNEYYYWYLQGYYYSSVNQYFPSITSDGNTNVYWILLKRNTTTNDSFYAENHEFVTNNAATLTTTDGNVTFWSDVFSAFSNITSGSTVYIDRIDNNRFRIKASTGSAPYRLRSATGTVSFSATVPNPTKNSVYIANNQFSNNELVKYVLEGATAIGGLTNAASYYIQAIDGNRFQLGSASGFSTEIDFTSSGVGAHTFENTTASFGVVDGSYTTTKAVDETTLEVTMPFKIPPASKGFNANTDVITGESGYITINNHYFSTGTKVIYDNNGGTSLTGLTHNTDYYIIVIDNSIIKLASSLQNATNGTAIEITAKPASETHSLITANLSGLVSGTGTVSVTSGSRYITGTDTAFQRFYKIGDNIRIVNTTTTPGVIVEKTITSVASDTLLLVDTAYDFTRSTMPYLISSYIYVRPDGFFLHRPFDGGMEIGTSKSPNSKITRQTRKYFRYQSGKGIQTSFAINFTPQIPLISLAYTPTGTQTIVSATGVSGDNFITVSSNTGIIVDMPVSGTGIAPETRVKAINGTKITLTSVCSSTVSGNITFGVVHYATGVANKPHNLGEDLQITVTDGTSVDFRGSYKEVRVVDDFTFKYILNSAPANQFSGGYPTISVEKWADCFIRAGMFDDQNGFFFEFDGSDLTCVRRSSVQQLPGKISVTNGSGIIIGINTSFTSQLTHGDYIVVRGMSYRVVKITNNTQITVQPGYRGITASNVICTKTIDTKVSQPNWSLDYADGNGPSGYILDTSKIQMCYMDYSWYGAGKIRYGFKDQNGHVKYVHEFKHNNKLTESYFRSGNLPARYEIENGNAPSYVGSLFHWGTSVIMDGMFQDDEAYLFTASGNVLKYTNAITQTSSSNSASVIEQEFVTWNARRYYLRIPFASSEASKLTINTLVYNPSVANDFFASGRPIDSRSRISGSTYFVYILYREGTTTIFPSNYGSIIAAKLGNPAVPSATTFNVGAPAGSDNLIPSTIPLISIRLAPSVDSSLTGALGSREIINRMQLQLDSLGVLTTHESEISLILNAALNVDNYENVDSPSLCQLIKHGPSDTISGGQRILSFRASGGSVEGTRRLTGSTDFNLSQISSLGNSIIGGDGIYPNGPDLLTIVANVVDSTGVSTTNPYSVTGRVTWQESQA